MINPGQLNKRVEFYDRTQVSDNAGGFEDGLKLVKEVWANISPVSGREFYQAQAAQVEISHKITIRYSQLFNRTQIIKHDGRTFEIQFGIEHDKRFIEFHCIERL
jgi:SPP1 family predicted phage head-tail adaptor